MREYNVPETPANMMAKLELKLKTHAHKKKRKKT